MSDLPPESEKLLAVAPNEFVAERGRLVRELREAGHPKEAVALAAMRKPSAVVLAVNRAARDRPNAARDAVEAAVRLEKAQAGGDPDAFRAALSGLDDPLDLLSEVALAHVGQGGQPPTDGMRRRVHDLVRRAVGSEETRKRLGRGALLEEEEATGFDAFAGMPMKKTTPRTRSDSSARTPVERKDEVRRARVQALREQLKAAELELEEASKAVRSAERERAGKERALGAIRAKLDRLS